MDRRGNIHCPCARREPGADLLGVVQPNGRVQFLPPGLTVDEGIARLDRPSEVAFRYSARCAESACLHWHGGRCTALDEVRSFLSSFALTTIPSCPIRTHCCWHHQAGDAACAVCPLVTGELMALEDGIERPEEALARGRR